MLRMVLIGFLSLTLMGLSLQPAAAALQRSVNAVLGDRSYSHRFGHLPGPEANETLRIQTHLAYVEGQLRRHTPQAIPAQFHAQRRQLLDFLHQYWTTGVFPSQNAYPGRRPHFIDEQGRLCAVGHLIAQSAGRGLAERINARYRYAYLPEMQMPELDSWVASSGLTARELAMIQPTYGGYRIGPSIGRSYEPGIDGYAWLCAGSIFLAMGLPLFHLYTLSLPSEQYLEIQSSVQGMTYAVLGTAAVFNLLSPILSANNGAFILIGGLALLVFVPFNLVLLQTLDQHHRANLQAKPPISLGHFPLADGSSAWGLQASLLF
ncbi:MAG: hypothetical protein IV090_23770 [Candidatus Sericytochromatia bacterium]|nr:hypothetical protein [Candidatus Sericytochromatia bacterium]